MKKIAIILILSSFLGCKTKRVLKSHSKEEIKTEEISKSETIHKEAQKQTKTDEKVQSVKEDIKEEKTDVSITGKTDKDNPVTFYNIVNKDTVDYLKITGTADFVYKRSSNFEKSSSERESKINTSESKESDVSISNAVENVKNTVKDVHAKTVEVVKKDFTIGSYLIFFIWGLVIIAVIILLIWLKKSNLYKTILNIFKF